MLKIWGRVNSINVMKVLWCADELGLEYQRIDAGLAFGVVNEDWYTAMNPNAKVPTIDDDGFVLWESNAIVRYLGAKHGAGTLYPDDLRARADGDRWMDWQLSTLAEGMGYLFWGLVRNSPAHQDPDKRAAAAATVAEQWGIVDRALDGRSYLAGDQFTIGDIPLGCFMYRWSNLPDMPSERPRFRNLEAWYARLQERKAYREHVMLPLT